MTLNRRARALVLPAIALLAACNHPARPAATSTTTKVPTQAPSSPTSTVITSSATASRSPSSPPPPSPPPPSGAGLVISNTDQGKTFTLKIGQVAELRLGSGLRWSAPTVTGTASLVLTPENLPASAGYQGWRLRATSPGQAILSSTGMPNCLAGEVCAQFVMLFRVTILVT